MAGGGGERTLEETPTWALASVCFILVSFSVIVEFLIHLLAKYFAKTRRKLLIQALDKIKSELMVLGFISLLLTVCEQPISKFCLPISVGLSFLPCDHMILSSETREEEASCQAEGKVSLMSRSGVRELQYLIFVMASFHSLSCILIFGLGMAKMRRWQLWEEEMKTFEYQFSKDPTRFQLTHQTSFGKRHLGFRFSAVRYISAGNFTAQSPKFDYLTLRHGFMMAHFEQGSNFVFDFQKYIRRALEKDFGVLAGISLRIWMSAISYIFFNAHKFHSYMWLPFIPLVNSFQLAFFTWTWFKFGLKSCFNVIRLSIGVLVHFLCGYVTLPLYALVTQMGTTMREAVFRENVVEGLQRWRARARNNLKRSSHLASPISCLDGSQDVSISLISSSFPNNSDAFHTIIPDGPLLLPTKDVVIQVQNGEVQADQELRKMGSFT